MKKYNKSLVIGLMAILFSSPSIGLSDISTEHLFELSLDELLDVEVEIATGKPQKLSHVPAVANVITASDIAAMGVTSFEQVLAMIPGVHVYPDPVARLDPHFSIRGIQTADNSQVLVLVNGHDVTYVATGSTPSGFRMPVVNISRIEVMRSPGSALYGADAFAGVINIITKDAAEIGGINFGWRQGSFRTQDVWLQHAAELDEWDFTFSLESSNSDGDKNRVVAYDDQNAFSGNASLETYYDYTNTEVTLSNSAWTFRLWNWNLNKGGVGQGATQIPDSVGSDTGELYLFDIQHESQDLIPGWGLNSRLSYELFELDTQFVLSPPSGVWVEGKRGDPGSTQRKGTFSLRADYTKLAGHRLLVGVGSEWVMMNPREAKNFITGSADGIMVDVTGDPNYVFMTRESRTVNHLLLQDEWAINDDWAMTAGVRYDDYSDFGNTTNPRVAVVWMGMPKLTTKFLYGRAFRAPTFSELYFRNNPATIGNPDLSAESIDTYEVVFDYRPLNEVNLVLSLFSYRIDGLIDRVPGFPAQNRGEQKGRGFELEGNWHVNSKLQLRGFYAFQNAEDGMTGADVPNAPQQQIYANVNWGFQPLWFLGAQAKWIADRKRAVGDPRAEISDYTIVDLTLRRRQLLPNMDFTFSVRNLFDEDAREPATYNPANSQGAVIAGDYPMASRSYYGEISFSF